MLNNKFLMDISSSLKREESKNWGNKIKYGIFGIYKYVKILNQYEVYFKGKEN